MSDLVEVIPTLLGFHPSDSIVLVVVEDGHVALTARSDLPKGRPGPLVKQLRPVWERHGADALYLMVAYTADAALAWRVLSALDAAVPGSRRLVHADGVRCREEPDEEGLPYDVHSGVLAAEGAYRGLLVRESRDELVRLLDVTATPDEVSDSLERVGSRLQGAGELCREAVALLERHDGDPESPPLTLDEATLLCLASHDQAFLDASMLSTRAENARRRKDLCVQAVRSSVPSCIGGLLELLALASWVSGDGALQVVCLERLSGLRASPEWFDFLDAVNRDVVPPTAWDGLRQAYLDDRARGVGRAS